MSECLIEKVGYFDTILPNAQDYELWLRMSPYLKIKIIPKILGTYFEVPTSITSRSYYKRLPAEFRVSWKHRDKGNKLSIFIKILKLFINKSVLMLIYQYVLKRVNLK